MCNKSKHWLNKLIPFASKQIPIDHSARTWQFGRVLFNEWKRIVTSSIPTPTYTYTSLAQHIDSCCAPQNNRPFEDWTNAGHNTTYIQGYIGNRQTSDPTSCRDIKNSKIINLAVTKVSSTTNGIRKSSTTCETAYFQQLYLTFQYEKWLCSNEIEKYNWISYLFRAKTSVETNATRHLTETV